MTGRRRTRSARFPLRAPGDPWLYAVARVVLVPPAVLYGRFRVYGAEQVPSRGAALVVANHPSDIDPILIALAVRRPLRFMADAVQFDRRFVGPVIRRLGAFPVRVGSPDITAVHTALELLAAGEVVAIFPEGDVTGSGWPSGFHRGVGLLAARSGAPVVPAGITGAEHLWRDGRPHRPAIEVRFGRPVRLGEVRPDARDYDRVTLAVRAAVTSMLAAKPAAAPPLRPPSRRRARTPHA